MKYMSNHPNVQRKLRAHVLATMPYIHDRPLRYEDLGPVAAPYLEAVVQETLRFSRTVAAFARTSGLNSCIWTRFGMRARVDLDS
jgi:cytochrome P450